MRLRARYTHRAPIFHRYFLGMFVFYLAIMSLFIILGKLRGGTDLFVASVRLKRSSALRKAARSRVKQLICLKSLSIILMFKVELGATAMSFLHLQHMHSHISCRCSETCKMFILAAISVCLIVCQGMSLLPAGNLPP